eukprot:2207246-Rhodomonas_salina.5
MLPAIDNKRSPSGIVFSCLGSCAVPYPRLTSVVPRRAIPTFEMTAANVKTFTNSMNPRPGIRPPADPPHSTRAERI